MPCGTPRGRSNGVKVLIVGPRVAPSGDHADAFGAVKNGGLNGAPRSTFANVNAVLWATLVRGPTNALEATEVNGVEVLILWPLE